MCTLTPDLGLVVQERRAGGASLRTIAAELMARGIPTSRGGAWNAVQVKRILDRVTP